MINNSAPFDVIEFAVKQCYALVNIGKDEFLYQMSRGLKVANESTHYYKKNVKHTTMRLVYLPRDKEEKKNKSQQINKLSHCEICVEIL